MRNVREVRKLLLKLPPGVDGCWLVKLESQFDRMAQGHDVEGCTISLCERLFTGDEGREWSNITPTITRTLVSAMAYAFPECSVNLIDVSRHILELKEDLARYRMRSNDFAILTALIGIPELANLCGSDPSYRDELARFLREAVAKRFFKEAPTDPAQCSALSPIVKGYFDGLRFYEQRRREVAELVGLMGNIIRDNDDVDEKSGEGVLFNEFFFKSFNRSSLKRRSELVVQALTDIE